MLDLGLAVASEKNTQTVTEIFGQLYEEYLPKVFRYISYRVDDNDMAEDLTSAVFEKALTRLDSYRSDKAAFSTWIFSIARNKVIDHQRSSGRQVTVAFEQVPEVSSSGTNLEEEAIKREESQKLQILLTGLSEREKEIVSLKFGAELNNRQIARRLNLSESNVGTILYRAICKLRDGLREQ